MGNQFTPAGAVQYFARKTAPEGWLVADGREVSRTQYPDLFAAIRVDFGMGDGIDTFNLPDLRGEFIRGLDSGRGVDAERKFGSLQTDAFQGHWHNHRNATANISSGVYGGGFPQFYAEGVDYLTRDAVTDNVHGTPRTASETRPRNIALLACIKY